MGGACMDKLLLQWHCFFRTPYIILQILVNSLCEARFLTQNNSHCYVYYLPYLESGRGESEIAN
jgi:hypothetical protein